MKEKNIGINAILNVIRQALSIIFPLVTYPYALRILGPTNIGKVNYVQSIISYFALIASIGVSNYIIREGSQKKSNIKKFTTFICEVYTINIYFTILSYFLLIMCTLFIPKLKEYQLLLFVQGISIGLTTLGIEWINTIYEDFLRLTLRSICTYIITIILLFVFVRNETDYIQYALLTVVTNGIICISNRIAYRKKIKLKMVKRCNIKTHIGPLIVMFANSIAVTINASFDMTMLGWMKGAYYAGVYSLAAKVYTVLKSLFGAIYVVAIPRLSFLYGTEKIDEYKNLNTKIFQCLLLLIIPGATGLVCAAEPIIVLIGGKDLLKAKMALQLLAIALIFASLSGMLMNAVNISLKREKSNLNIIVFGTLTNVLLNIAFIPRLFQTGAALATMLSEIFIFIYTIIKFKDIIIYLDIKKIKKSFFYSAIGAILICIYVHFIKQIIMGYLLQLLIIFVGSILIYSLFLIIGKEECCQGFISRIKFKIRTLNKKD